MEGESKKLESIGPYWASLMGFGFSEGTWVCFANRIIFISA